MKGSTLLDGRHRMMACEELKINPPVEQYKGANEVGMILSRNVFRRHLNADQRVTIIAEAMAPQLVKEAEEREKAGKATDGEKPTGEAAMLLATEAKVGQHRARRALTLVKHGSKSDVKRVIAGKETLASAAAEAKRKTLKKQGKKAPKPKVIDKTTKEFVNKRFLNFMDYWPVTQHRTVKSHLREFLK
jgi:hypothetical protein